MSSRLGPADRRALRALGVWLGLAVGLALLGVVGDVLAG